MRVLPLPALLLGGAEAATSSRPAQKFRNPAAGETLPTFALIDTGWSDVLKRSLPHIHNGAVDHPVIGRWDFEFRPGFDMIHLQPMGRAAALTLALAAL